MMVTLCNTDMLQENEDFVLKKISEASRTNTMEMQKRALIRKKYW